MKEIKAWIIVELIFSCLLIFAGAFPFIYIYCIYDTPDGDKPDKEVETTGWEFLAFICMMTAMGYCGITGIDGVVIGCRKLWKARAETEEG